MYGDFYVNDAGNADEIRNLPPNPVPANLSSGEDQVPFPEDGYQGDDIKDRAMEFSELNGDAFCPCRFGNARKALVDYALPENIDKMKTDQIPDCLRPMVLESTIHNEHKSDETTELLKTAASRTAPFGIGQPSSGAEKDEVLIRQNGDPTYFAADIAYHRNKLKTHFDRCIDIWGADHHGHVPDEGRYERSRPDGDKLDVILSCSWFV